jgi:hypothetical protein
MADAERHDTPRGKAGKENGSSLGRPGRPGRGPAFLARDSGAVTALPWAAATAPARRWRATWDTRSSGPKASRESGVSHEPATAWPAMEAADLIQHLSCEEKQP